MKKNWNKHMLQIERERLSTGYRNTDLQDNKKFLRQSAWSSKQNKENTRQLYEINHLTIITCKLSSTM
jgi:hypothetical protein